MPTVALTVDGTGKTCKGVIAKLETEARALPPGSVVRAIVPDVPTRIDVRAWVDRKGHQLLEDQAHDGGFELLIVTGSYGEGAGGQISTPSQGP